MNFAAIVLTCLAAGAIFCLPRKHVLTPLIAGSICLPPYNALSIATIDLPVLRLLLFCLFLRMMMRNEARPRPPSRLDRYVIWWAVWMTLSYLALTFSFGAIINRLGTIWVDAVLAYFLCRNYMPDMEAVLRTSYVLVMVTLLLAVTTAVEYFKGFNCFSLIGGMNWVQVRGDTIRCQGPFGHPISLGSFAAFSLPLIWAFHMAGMIRRMRFLMLSAGSMSVVIFSGSSSPVFTLAAALVAVALWWVRRSMPQIRWTTIALICMLELVMTSHVWWLMARLNPMGGSAYHRAKLIDHFLARFGEWWLFGTRENAAWGGGGYMTNDVANHLLRMGTQGGIVSIIIFLCLFGSGFKAIGKFVDRREIATKWKVLLWAFGCILFAHLATFIGLSYWDQMRFILYLHLAMIASALGILAKGPPTKEPITNPVRAEDVEAGIHNVSVPQRTSLVL